MKSVEIEVFARTPMTKNELGRFRTEGNVPAILYGKHIDNNLPLSFNSTAFSKILSTYGKASILVFKSNDSKLNGTSALVKEIQKDSITSVFLNVDLVEIRKGEKITVKVPIEFVGEAAGAKSGGVVDVQRRELEIECLPADILDKVTVDISKLELNDVLHISDLKLADGIKIKDDGSYALVSVRIVKEKVVEAPTALLEGAEGAVPAEGVAPAEGAAAATGVKAAPGAAPTAGAKPAPGAAPAAGAKDAKAGAKETKK
jgi:large subunit ribosomal protein L25